jgi:hypothetical protein
VIYAASNETPRQPTVRAGLFIAFAIAYLSRRRAIGGWLLYFYIQLYLSFAISLLFFPQIISNLNPKQWDNSLLYVMFILSVVPVILAEFMEIIAATKLLFRKNIKNVTFLRKILLALLTTSAIAFAIDIVYFKDDPAFIFDILTLVFAIIWSLYFFKARRVRLVFIENNWVYTPHSERRVLTTEDKKKLRKRALISALVIFVLFLVMMGSTLQKEGKQPDMGIFVVPLFYSIITAIIAWYLPLRKKKIKTTSVIEDEHLKNKEEK